MSQSHDSPEPRASRWEILGAWLNVWTAPHDVVVPPPPSRRTLALLGAALLAVVAAIVLLVAPVLREIADRDAADAQRALDGRRAARAEQQRVEQRPRFGIAKGASREVILAAVGAAIGADARQRFDPDARTAACEPAPGIEATVTRAVLDCSSSVRDIVGGGRTGSLSIPYRAVVDLTSGRYAFCKVNPPPGEQALIDPRYAVPIPAACSSRDPDPHPG